MRHPASMSSGREADHEMVGCPGSLSQTQARGREVELMTKKLDRILHGLNEWTLIAFSPVLPQRTR